MTPFDKLGGRLSVVATTATFMLALTVVASCSSDDTSGTGTETTVDEAAETTEAAREIADRFLTAMADEDIDAIADATADDAVLVHPISFDGSQDPQVRFEGEDQILGYVETVFANFATIAWRDADVNVTDDGRTVFIETKGDFTLTRDGSPYDNVYVIRFDIRDNQVVRSAEYYNPLIAAPALDIPITLPDQ